MSIVEGVFEGQRWEMQLKGGGPTPYCRGADGRAVLRSSVREFLAQEFMHALGVPTSRSLTLYRSEAETVRRPWYSDQSRSFDPDVMVDNQAAISTRVAPSFLRVGQIELFARRARDNAHPDAQEELRLIVQHLIDRNYRTEIDAALPFHQQVLELARLFRSRLTALVANWMRVGYCQGNFNSDKTKTRDPTIRQMMALARRHPAKGSAIPFEAIRSVVPLKSVIFPGTAFTNNAAIKTRPSRSSRT